MSAGALSLIGILSALSCIIFGAVYIFFMLKRSEKKGEGFMKTGALMDKDSGQLNNAILQADCTNVQFFKALAPSIVLLVAMNVFDVEPFVSLTIGCLVCLVLYFKRFQNLGKTCSNGCASTMKAIMMVKDEN